MELSETGLDLADPQQDIRDRKVIDASGASMSFDSALCIVKGERKIRMLEFRGGEARKMIVARVDLSSSAAEMLSATVIVCRATRKCVIAKAL